MDTALVCAASDLKALYQFDGTRSTNSSGDLLVQYPDRRIDAQRRSGTRGGHPGPHAGALGRNRRQDPDRGLWEALAAESRRAAENAAVAVASDIDWAACVADGEFARYVEANAVLDLLGERPDLVLDGKLFRSTYTTLGADTRADQVARLSGARRRPPPDAVRDLRARRRSNFSGSS